ncbi:hypothetical protein BDR26DRAFT_917921 [Obelidium mucronatum]|nr:hypothetical protein BDR26DRAFT_917921 [Obelidium mucronatum]
MKSDEVDQKHSPEPSDALATSQWNAVPGLQTAPTVISSNQQQQQHSTGHISSWSARPATPLTPPSSSTIDWSSSSNDWSSRSANAATRASKPVAPVIVDTWSSSSQTPTSNVTPTETSGWGPPPVAAAGNGWGATPAVASTVNANPAPTPVGDNWGPAKPPSALSGGSWAPSFPSGANASVSRRTSFHNGNANEESSSAFANGVQRRPSELTLRSNNGGGWGSPSVPSNTTQSGSSGWGTVPGTSASAGDGWGAVQGVSSASRSSSTPLAPSGSGWGAAPAVSTTGATLSTSPKAANGNWGSTNSTSTSTSSPSAPANDGWKAQTAPAKPAAAAIDSWGSVSGTSSASSATRVVDGWSSVPGASTESRKDVESLTASSVVNNPKQDGWGSTSATANTSNGWGASAAPASAATSASNDRWGPSPSAPVAKDKPTSGWDSVPGARTATVTNKMSSQNLNSGNGWAAQSASPPASGWDSSSPSSSSAVVSNWSKETPQTQTAPGSGWGSAPAVAKESTAATATTTTGWNSVPGVSTNATIQDARPSIGGWSSPSPVGSQSNGWTSASAIPSSQSKNGWNTTPSTNQSSAAASPSRKESQQQGWGPSPIISPDAGSGWNSPSSNASATGAPARPARGTGGIGGWNPSQSWNSGATTSGSANQKPVVGAPRGPPSNGLGGWGGGVSSSLSSAEPVQEPSIPPVVNNIGVIGGGMRRSSSTSEFKREDSNNSVGEQLFSKSFADISIESTIPAKDELANAIGVYVFGLPATFKIREILAIFGEFGDVVNVGLTPKSLSNQRAYAHIEYEMPGSAAKAIRATHGKNVTASSDALEVVPDFGTGIPPISNVVTAPTAAVFAAPSAPAPAPAPVAKVQMQPVQPATNSAVDAATENRTLHIANAPLSVDKTDVERIFGRGAEIRFINIVPRPKEKRNMVFVTFKNHSAAAKALFTAKTGKHFGMVDSLKVDFSKAETRSIAANSSSSASGSGATPVAANNILGAATKKKSEASLASKAANDKKTLSEKKSTSSLTGSISGASGGKKTAMRPSLYIRDISDFETVESLRATLSQVGPVATCHIVTRLDGAARYGLVTFENGDDAARAVRDKVENAVYPRQRRLTVTNLPKGTLESQVLKAFQSCGEIKRVDFSNGNTTAELEFARGDGAILAHIFIIEGKITLLGGIDGGYSLPSNSTGSMKAGDDGSITAPTDAAFSSGGGADDASEHHQYEHADHEDVEVIRLDDLEE